MLHAVDQLTVSERTVFLHCQKGNIALSTKCVYERVTLADGLLFCFNSEGYIYEKIIKKYHF